MPLRHAIENGALPRPPAVVDRLTPSEFLTPLPPFRAYADDVARLGGRTPLGPDDDGWLLLAQTLGRAATVAGDERGAVVAAGASALRETAAGAACAALGDELLAAARAFGEDDDVASERAVATLCAAVQRVVSAEERAGAFRLAFTTLAAAREMLARFMDARTEGLLLAQQGRVARQLGALETARTLYLTAARAGRRAKAPDVAARALLGLGALASMRGNYPEARASYRRVLGLTRRAGAQELERAAHQGLLVAAVAAGDTDTALWHGWSAFTETPHEDADTRAEMLVSLADVTRLAGQHRAALGACLTALDLTSDIRICLPALGIAAISSAHLGNSGVLVDLIERAESIMAHSGQPFENAFTLLELAEASATAGLDRGVELARRAMAIAEASAFHEIALRAQWVLDRQGSNGERDRAVASKRLASVGGTSGIAVQRWSPNARRALRALETLAPVHAGVAG
jgi:tetratricopeptide (TPR) repeat protein